MADIVVMGAGICGSASATLLAEDGHDVVVLERDRAGLPPSGPEAWRGWSRHGVAQFRGPHWLHPGGRAVLDSHLPQVKNALAAEGALTYNMLGPLPPPIAGSGPQPGDERFTTLTARRPVLEQAVAGVAEKVADVRRGVAVAELLTGPSDIAGVPHVAGVRTATGERITADLVVDATGRRSVLPGRLDAIGARPVIEEAESSGFFYYSRYFHEPGGPPPARAGLVSPLGTISLLYLPADNQTWSVTVHMSSRDTAMREVRRTDVWTNLVSSCPLHAHLLEGEPITDVLANSGTVDRYRRFVVDGLPVATGIVAVGDAWACTNPSSGRGMTLGLRHAVRLRDAVRAASGAPGRLVEMFDATTEAELVPWYRATLSVDRDRQAEIDALIDGRPVPPPGDETASRWRDLAVAMAYDPDLFRGFLDTIAVLDLPETVLDRPGLFDRVRTIARSEPRLQLPGPTREELLELVA
ncbi:Dehydrogenase (flavoprotein) [Pseudonocardia ammonioxydans]|uniref:Dehydrogenase (Flavoprotein) n=1 Tax=Pseudonocardia ammonioxydans TaxID=260086 RepID=A0A1I5ASX1_PSUAM|nr:NAD(P)-binding protein [Pseudonocardia ammonioxydans]SFN65515.1 Dehydrogenase (flavoprotein) [Pseudonocardia ammonioxydans]